MKSNLKVKLYEFRNSLPIEMAEIAGIVTEHINYTDTHSEKEIFGSLNSMLESHMYSNDVKAFLESIDNELSDSPILYALKDVYAKLARKNNNFLYQPIMNTVIECITANSEEERKAKIIHDLAIHEWVEEVKSLVYNITENPQMRANLTSVGGIVEDIYSVVIESENGYLSFIDESWYLFNEDGVTQTLLEYHIPDMEILKRLRLLEQTCKVATFGEDTITFKIAENFNVVLNTKNKQIYINDNLKEVETTLETLFNSPVVPFESKGFYPVINETMTNLDKFVNIDAAKYIWNPINKAFESIIFNFNGNFYQTRKSNNGRTFMKFENALPLIENIRTELGADVTFFFENALSEELKTKINLETQIKSLSESIEKVEESILMIKEEQDLMNENESIKGLYKNLLTKKHKLNEELKNLKSELFKFK